MTNRQTAVIEMIADGDFDDHLEQLGDAIIARKKILAMNAGMRIPVGARVRFSDVPDNRDGWVGVEGDVTGKSRDSSKVKVKLDLTGHPRAHGEGAAAKIFVGRRRTAQHGQTWTVPAEWVEVI